MQHERQHVPVTALNFFKQDFILSGEGTHLCAYNSDFERCKNIRVFDGQAVHGIAVLETQPISTVAVWGGQFVRFVFVRQQDKELGFTLANLLTVHDWILDLAFAPCEEPLAALLTAHNALWTLAIHDPSKSEHEKHQVSCERKVTGSNCILYAAHVTWLSSSRCLIASGTAFGAVIVWSAILDNVHPSRCQTHYAFSAHEGSVFGVRLSSHLSTAGVNCDRMLATCSDDRTIRIWDISDLTLQAPPNTGASNDTGLSTMPTIRAAAPRIIAKTMGHISRIWNVRFLYPVHADEPVKMLSIGEDAAAITWILSWNNDDLALKQSAEITPHAGKNIWSVAWKDSSGVLITGGADGAVARQYMGHDSLLIMEVTRKLLNGDDGHDNFRSYALVGQRTLLATTDRGRVITLDLNISGSPKSPEEIAGPLPGLQGYSFVSSSSRTAFVGGKDGTIYIYTHRTRALSKLVQVDRKIAGMFASEDRSERIMLLAASVGSSTAKMIAMDSSEPNKITDLALPPGFVITSFVHFALLDSNYGILGSRHGSLAIYQYREEFATPLEYMTLLTQVHRKDAVTCLRWMARGGNSASGPCGYLMSTGRDGTLAVHVVLLGDCKVELQLVHQLSLPIGPNLEGLHLDDNGILSTIGFRSKHFVVYNVTEQRETMKVECGGAHRNWAFQPYQLGWRFVWTKASQVFQAEQLSVPYQLVNSGGHGREIKALAISAFDSQHVIATGGEDTDIKLFAVHKDGFRCIQTLTKHNTGVQDLQWHQLYLFSSAGFEEFFIWKVTPDIPHIEIGVMCESKHPRTGTSDLRIMGFDVVNAIEDAGFVITMAYSDSTLKVWRYLDRSWWLATTGDYLTSCLSHTFRVGYPNNEIFTAATDGHIARWSLDHEEELEWAERHKIHQNAIHEVVHVEVGQSGTSLIMTGGDDNAIGITRIGQAISAATLLIPKAHAGAVTGLAVVAVDEGSYWLVSASIDQRVKLWRIDVDVKLSGVGGIDVLLLHDVFTAVADVSKLEIYQSGDGSRSVLICGVGMDMWRLPLT